MKRARAVPLPGQMTLSLGLMLNRPSPRLEAGGPSSSSPSSSSLSERGVLQIPQRVGIAASSGSVVSDACDSASALIAQELEMTKAKLDAIILAEVQDWLHDLKEAVVDGISLAGVKQRRLTYTAKSKVTIVNALDSLKKENPNASKVELQEKLRKATGSDKVQLQSVEKWGVSSKPERKRGRKVNEAFEKAVLDQLVFTTLEKVDGREQALVIANVCYSHAVIAMAVNMVKAQPEFANDLKVQACKASRPWIKGWTRRNAMRKRRISAQVKKLPEPAEVQAAMEAIQKTIEEKQYTASEVRSGDETGMLFGAAPVSQFIPLSADRATAPEADDKARWTSFLSGNGEGEMDPSFNIVKCASKNAFDLSGTKVIQNLHKLTYFSASKGWSLKTWERAMMLPPAKSKEPALIKCKRPYLIHEDGTVITCQNKAWMDSAGMAMMADVQIGPRMHTSGRRCFMIWDNCGPHKVAAVRQVYEEWGIECAELPPKMTDILQVMDLVVNGPLKAAIRRRRCHGLFDYFQSWKVKRLAATVNKTALPPFEPPKPKLADGLEALIDCCKSSLATREFKASMKRTFVKVGLLKDESSKTFRIYKSHKKLGMVDVLPSTERAVWNEVNGDDEITSFGEIAAEVVIGLRREEDLRDEEGEEEEEGAEEAEEESDDSDE